MDDELVSVITPVYNSERYIKDTIESVIHQTYKKWEMIIVDDCSSDKTKEIIDKYISSDQRIKYYNLSKNSGVAIARNKAIEVAQGRFIAFLDADDLWSNDKLEYQLNYMRKYGYSFTFADYELINDEGNSLHKRIVMPKNINYNKYLINTILTDINCYD